MKKQKQNRAITLIALIITVIVILILAGVSISVITGQDSIFTKTQTSVDKYNKAEALEQMNLKVSEVQMKYYSEENRKATLEEMANYLTADEYVEYVKGGKEIASIDFTKYSSILVKLKAYVYEFEIGDNMQVALIGQGLPTEPEIDPDINLPSGLYNGDNYTSWADLKTDGIITVTDSVLTKCETTAEGKLIIDSEVTSIGKEAFGNWRSSCVGITKVVIPNSVTSIGVQAFYLCTGLISVIIPNSVTSIGASAFSDCTNLTSVNIPEGVTSIGEAAFYKCTNLTAVNIPSSVTNIGIIPFAYCSGITRISVDSKNNVYDSRENCNAIISKSDNRLLAGCKNTIIPNDVVSIEESAFSGCTGLTSVIIPNSVTNIGANAFGECTALTTIDIPSSVTSIVNLVFWNCTGLTSVTIPNSVTSIGASAFAGCTSLSSVNVPNSVTSIFYNAFYDVPHVYYHGTSPDSPWGAKAVN